MEGEEVRHSVVVVVLLSLLDRQGFGLLIFFFAYLFAVSFNN